MKNSEYKKRKRIRKSLKRKKKTETKNIRFNGSEFNFHGEEHFDNIAIERVIKLLTYNPYQALLFIEQYLEEYQDDYYMKAFYVKTLIYFHELDKAKIVIDDMENSLKHDKVLRKYKTRIEKNTISVILSRIRYLVYSNNYQEAYNYIVNCQVNLDELYLDKLLMYLKVMLGQDDYDIHYYNSYSFDQLVEYSEDSMLNHITKHLASGNVSALKPNLNIFNSSFPVEELLEEIKKYIPSSKALYSGLYEDDYYFKYDNCGRDEGKITDYFLVICYHNTSRIITIFPIKEITGVPFVDLNYTKNGEYVYKINMIERFNKRYGLKK